MRQKTNFVILQISSQEWTKWPNRRVLKRPGKLLGLRTMIVFFCSIEPTSVLLAGMA